MPESTTIKYFHLFLQSVMIPMSIHTPIMVLLISQIEEEAGEKGKKRESALPSKPPTPPAAPKCRR
jgi:hypothetical protein